MGRVRRRGQVRRAAGRDGLHKAHREGDRGSGHHAFIWREARPDCDAREGLKMKRAIRKEMRKKRDRLSSSEMEELSLKVKERLFSAPEFRKARTVMFY